MFGRAQRFAVDMANLEVPEYDAYAAAPSGDALLEDGTVVGLTPNQRAPRDDQRENTSMRLTWAAHASCARAPPRREKKSAGIGRPGPPQAAQGLSEPARLDQPRRARAGRHASRRTGRCGSACGVERDRSRVDKGAAAPPRGPFATQVAQHVLVLYVLWFVTFVIACCAMGKANHLAAATVDAGNVRGPDGRGKGGGGGKENHWLSRCQYVGAALYGDDVFARGGRAGRVDSVRSFREAPRRG